ncbi:hypothetical protein ACHAPU_001408 [Fusarium lateritium]
MRFISLCTVLSAALVSAAPCKPIKPTTTLESSATFATTSVIETTATETATATQTTLETTDTTEAPTDVTTVLETTITEAATETDTAVTSAATAETTAAEETTTTASEPEPTLLLRNGDFEDENNVDWDLRTAQIVDNPARAQSGRKYVEMSVVDTSAIGGNHLNQTLSGLDTSRLFRLKFSTAVFSDPEPSEHTDTCVIDAVKQGSVFKSWPLDQSLLNQYLDYETDFVTNNEDITLSLRLRCDPNKKVTLTIGIDNVSLTDVGEAPMPTN